MAFDAQKFLSTPFVLRTGSVDVPELAGMFDDGEKPVFKVRGLDGKEWGLAKEAIRKRRDMAAIFQKMASGNGGEIADAVADSLGLNDTTAAEDALRLTIFPIGLVEPELTETEAIDLSKKLLRHFPTAFERITTKISELTGTSDQGEACGSGKTPKSGPHSPSATKKGPSSGKRSRKSSHKAIAPTPN